MLIDDIRNSQNGNQEMVLGLVKKFSPTLKKHARKLETEDAYYDLQADFLELILHLDCDKLRETSDGAIVQYLSQSIYHSYIKHLRHLIDNKVPTISTDELTDDILYQNSRTHTQGGLLSISIPPELLSAQEADAFYQIKILGYSAAELSRKRGVSRQSVNQAKHRAISKLKKFFQENN